MTEKTTTTTKNMNEKIAATELKDVLTETIPFYEAEQIEDLENIKDMDIKDISLDIETQKWVEDLSNFKIKSNEKTFSLSKRIELIPGIYLNADCSGIPSKCENLNISFDEYMSYNEISTKVSEILKVLSNPSRKGFIIPKDLKIENTPVLSQLLKFMYHDEKYLSELDNNSSLLVSSYTWIWNLINLSMYTEMLKKLGREKIELKNSDLDDDDLSDYKNLMVRLHNNLDPSIRIKLTKPGISIIQNIYTGFDTEYKYVEKIYNKLISVQLAVNTRTILKMPKESDFELSKLGTLTGELYKLKSPEGFKVFLFEKIVNKCIQDIRYITSNKYDMITKVLYQGFINLAKSKPTLFKYFEKDGYLCVALPRTPLDKFVYLNDEGRGFKFKNVLDQSAIMSEKHLESDYLKVRYILNNLRKFYDGDISIMDSINNMVENNSSNSNYSDEVPINISTECVSIDSDMKRYSRSKIRSLDININRIKTIYVIAHLTNADLSMLDDFEELKSKLDIVSRSFVTLGKPIKINNYNVHIRDTMLLAPGGKKGLGAIGELLGFGKVELSKNEIEAMDLLLKNDKDKFLKYAITDAAITLAYANYMESELFESRKLGIPLTLSSLTSTYILDEWDKIGYEGYQVNPLYLIGDSGTTQTPQGLFKTKDIGLKISMFIANYRGGRNESFMYGIDNDRTWYDYDLTAAYPTAMALLGNPSYKESRNLTLKELQGFTDEELIMNYIVLSVKFAFPEGTKYPSIPCYLNETTTIYPLKGEAILTGIEYLLARNQRCNFEEVKDIFIIPFELCKEKDQATDATTAAAAAAAVAGGNKIYKNQPFKEIVSVLQAKRSRYPKKTLGNLTEKEKINRGYGLIVRGMSNKKKFDIKTGRTLRMEGGVLTNPILASWITSFVRCVIGEGLHNIDKFGGKAVSVTTDGFITDIDDFEYKVLSEGLSTLLSKYRESRDILVGKPDAYELKTKGIGIISWTTRGQFSLDSKISASTGFQSKGVAWEDLDSIFRNTMKGEDRIIEYIQGSLRSAKDIYVHGGHVTKTFADRVFRMEYDNKRVINVPLNAPDNDFSNTLLDSSPADTIEIVKSLRFFGNVHRTTVYNKMSNRVGTSKYKSNLELAIRNFIKGCVQDPPAYNMEKFENYSSLVNFIKEFKVDYRVSKASISNLKNRKIIVKEVPKNLDTLNFIEYVKKKFPNFDDDLFFGGNMKNR